MIKDWRISICSRYRPLAVFVLVITVWLLAILSFVAIGRVIQRNQEEAWDAKLSSVKVGTIKSDLIEILGEPQSIERIKSIDIQSIGGISSEELERVKKERPDLVEYSYYRTFFGMMSAEGYAVYLDKNEGRIVFIPSRLSRHLDGMSYLPLIVLFSFGVLAVVVWICFRSWCTRRMHKSGLAPAPGSHPEM